MVVGFRCGPEEYNEYTGQYTVHQSDAHAWVEVRTASGWKTYDPTSSRQSKAGLASGFMARLRNLLDFVEYTYANAIIAYDAGSQEGVRNWLASFLRSARCKSSGCPIGSGSSCRARSTTRSGGSGTSF